MKQSKLRSRRFRSSPIARFLRPAGTALLWLALAGPVPAHEKTPAVDRAAPTSDRRLAYLRALKEGRRQAEAGDPAGAMSSFRKALAAVPDDPAALSELGLAALRLKDYKLAEEATRKALSGIPEPAVHDKARLRAASLYNLASVNTQNRPVIDT